MLRERDVLRACNTGECEQVEELALAESPTQDGSRVTQPALVPGQDPHAVGSAGETPRPAADELHGPGLGEALAELAPDAGERVHLPSGLVAEADPSAHPIR